MSGTRFGPPFYLQAFSLVALTVELLNGGTRLQSTGNMYYSWDIRAVLFVLGLVFLLIYYKRYHMITL